MIISAGFWGEDRDFNDERGHATQHAESAKAEGWGLPVTAGKRCLYRLFQVRTAERRTLGR